MHDKDATTNAWFLVRKIYICALVGVCMYAM